MGTPRSTPASVAQDVFQHRPGGEDRGAEIAVQQLGDIDPELDVERLVERQLGADARIDLRQGAVADDGEHRVDRHDAADHESDREEAEEGQ